MRSKGTLVRRGAAAVGAGLLAVLVNIEPAAAHYNYINHDGNFASLNSSHTTVSICRNSSSGDAARVDFRDGVEARTFHDWSNNRSCVTRTVPSRFDDRWRLCTFWDDPIEPWVSCSSWRSL
jgi:hypothetical protein